MDIDISQAIAPLLNSLIKYFYEGNYELRREAAIALSKFKGEKITDVLLKTYETDNIQDFLALALGNIKTEEAVQMLINALNDPRQEVRFNAARALGKINNPDVLNILLEVLQAYVDLEAEGKDLATQDQEVTPTSQIFFEEDTIVSTINIIASSKSWRTVSLLKKAFDLEKNPKIRSAIIVGLGGMGTEKLMPVFQAALNDEDARVRANGIEAIQTIKTGSVVGIIQPYLDDQSNRVKANAAKAIWKYGDFDVSDTLKKMLSHDDKWHRASAIYAIGEISDERFLRDLKRTISDDDEDVRRNAVLALSKIGGNKSLELIKTSLSDEAFAVRLEAVSAIHRSYPEQAPELLTERLQCEQHGLVQSKIISVFSELHVPHSSELLLGFLDSQDEQVIINSINALANILSQDNLTQAFLDKLLKFIGHENFKISIAATKALWKLKYYEVLNVLLEILNSEDTSQLPRATYIIGELGTLICQSEENKEKLNLLLKSIIGESAMGISQPAQTTEDEPSQTSEPESETSPEKEVEPKPELQKPPLKKPQISDSVFAEAIQKANQLLANKEYEACKKILLNLLKRKPNDFQVLLGLANLSFATKNYDEAIDHYVAALAINPNIVKAQFNLGSLYYQAKRYELAAKHLLAALNIYPKILDAYLMLAQIYENADKFAEVIQLLQRAVLLSPKNSIIYKKLAMNYIRLKDYAKAQEIIITALKTVPLDVVFYVMLAHCLKLANKPDKAFEAFELALKACLQLPSPEKNLMLLLKTYVMLTSESQ